MVAFKILTEYFSENLHCGIVVNMPYLSLSYIHFALQTKGACMHHVSQYSNQVNNNLREASKRAAMQNKS